MGLLNGQVIDETDFLTLAQRNANPALDSGKTVKLESDGFLSERFIRIARTFQTYDVFDGSTTPRPVFIADDNTILVSDADNANRDEFHGFTRSVVSNLPAFQGAGTTGNSVSSLSYTVPAGNNRVLIVSVDRNPSSVTFNGTAMTLIGSNSSGGGGATQFVYQLALGSGAAITANIVLGVASIFLAATYNNVNQTTPTSGFQSAGNTSSNNLNTPNITPAHSNSVLVYIARAAAGTVTVTGSNRLSFGTNYRLNDTVNDQGTTFGNASNTGAFALCIVGFSLVGIPQNCIVEFTDLITGFTGLDFGSQYYVSNTLGAISATPGSTSLYVGRAISTTEILRSI